MIDGWVPPEGMKVEIPQWDEACAFIGSAELGWVTVDFKMRAFRLGMCTGCRGRMSATFSGRGWKNRLLNAAVESLLGVA